MGHRLLVVDSDRRFLQDHKASLEAAFDVDFREGTEGSLAHLEAGEYAAALLCVEASENKGYSLCSAVRRSPLLADLKVGDLLKVTVEGGVTKLIVAKTPPKTDGTAKAPEKPKTSK